MRPLIRPGEVDAVGLAMVLVVLAGVVLGLVLVGGGWVFARWLLGV